MRGLQLRMRRTPPLALPSSLTPPTLPCSSSPFLHPPRPLLSLLLLLLSLSSSFLSATSTELWAAAPAAPTPSSPSEHAPPDPPSDPPSDLGIFPTNQVLIYSHSDEWGRRSPDRWRNCAAQQLACQITWNSTLAPQASALLIHAPDHRNETIPSVLLDDPTRRPLYYFTDEAPPWFATPTFLSHFDMISTYDLLSDAPRPYILGPDLLKKMRGFGQAALAPGAHERLMRDLSAKLAHARSTGAAPIAWIVSNCGADRSYYVAELMKHIPVDIYGAAHCLGSTLTLPGRNDDDKEPENALLRSSYFFYLSLENHNCRDYVTEKLFRPLNNQVVPIADGPTDYGPFLPTSRSALRLDDYDSPAELAAHISVLLHHLDEYAAYLNFSQLSDQFVQANDRSFDGWCELCEHAHRAKMQIKAAGVYMRVPTRYRLAQLQLCVHNKWEARYCNNETAIVTTAQSDQYKGRKVQARQWWKEWEAQPTLSWAKGTRQHQWPQPHGTLVVAAAAAVVGPGSPSSTACSSAVEPVSGAVYGLCALQFVLLAVVAIRWRWSKPRSPQLHFHRRREP